MCSSRQLQRARTASVAVLFCAAVIAPACGGGDSALPGPSPTATVETFSGTVAPGGSSFHSFSVSVAGNVEVTLTEAGPPPTIYMGLAVGSVSGTDCVPAVGAAIQAQAGATAQLFGAAGVGQYCVVVFDVGNQAASVTYSVKVSHF
ncbi:MAG: hypothetical protein AB7Q29_18865 [Vicinamibacterales bacterium]